MIRRMIGNGLGKRKPSMPLDATPYSADRLMPRIKHAHFLAALQMQRSLRRMA